MPVCCPIVLEACGAVRLEVRSRLGMFVFDLSFAHKRLARVDLSKGVALGGRETISVCLHPNARFFLF